MGTIVKDLDGSLNIADEKSIAMLYDLLDTEGLYLGASSALNVVAAIEVAQKLGPGMSLLCTHYFRPNFCLSTGHTVATILCDGAYRYQSRLFSKKWLQSKSLDSAIPEHLKKYAVLD